MVTPRRVIALPTDAEQRQRLLEISRSRTEPTNRVERARIILAYLQNPRVSSKLELKERLMAFIDDINREPVVPTWRYKIDNAA
jgi:hypothetical protein